MKIFTLIAGCFGFRIQNRGTKSLEVKPVTKYTPQSQIGKLVMKENSSNFMWQVTNYLDTLYDCHAMVYLPELAEMISLDEHECAAIKEDHRQYFKEQLPVMIKECVILSWKGHRHC